MSLRKKKRRITHSLMKKAKEFYDEWIIECEANEFCVQQCEVLAVMKHLELEFELIYQLDILFPPMCPDIARWYGIKWSKELPCKVDYVAEIIADMQNEMDALEHKEVHKGNYVYNPHQRARSGPIFPTSLDKEIV